MDITIQNCFGGSMDEDGAFIIATDFGYFVISNTDSNDGDITNFLGVLDIWLTAIDSSANLLWERCYGGSSGDHASNIIVDSSGYYYFGGCVWSNDGDIQSGNHGGYDRWVVKIDATGEIIWERCYGGSFFDYPAHLLMLSDGNIIVYGATDSMDGDIPVNYGGLDVWLTIINPDDGEIIENEVFGNSDDNNIFDLIQTRDGGFFFTSRAIHATGMVVGEEHGGDDVWAVKLDSNLNIQWQKLYGGSQDDYHGWGLLELEDGYIFLSNSMSDDGDVTGFHGIPGELGTSDIWVMKIDTIGNIIWEKCLGGSGLDDPREIIQSNDGGFIIFAQTNSHDGDVWDLHGQYTFPQDDIWMVKLSPEGNIEWSRCYGGDGNEQIYFDGVVKKAEDNYVIAGWVYGTNTGDVNCNLYGMRDLWLFEIKDCNNYMPAIPSQLNGPDTLCTTTDSISTYTINPAARAWYYEWLLTPSEAGTLNSDSTLALLHWTANWEGQAEIKVRSWNDCGNSEWSEVHNSWAYSCFGLGDMQQAKPAFVLFPNPAQSEIHCRLSIVGCRLSMYIYDLFGRKQHEIQIPKGQEQGKIDVTDFSPGIYFAVLKNEKGILGRRKFVVR